MKLSLTFTMVESCLFPIPFPFFTIFLKQLLSSYTKLSKKEIFMAYKETVF